MSETTLWEVYCVTDSQYERTLSVTKPTVCPVNAGHTIRGVRQAPDDYFIEFGVLNTANIGSTDAR